jgi:hypothetical protein
MSGYIYGATMKADDLVNQTMTKAQTLDVDQLDDFFIKMGVLSMATLRGIHGDQFVTDFMTAALNDENPIKIEAHLRQ